MFTSLLKSNFGDSATPLILPLEPRLKSGQDAASARPPPDIFQTGLGDLHVPRQRDPKKPTYDMIKDARSGILSGFLRSGRIIRASDLVGEVNPRTAIITLHNIYELETRSLAAIESKSAPQLPLSSIVPFNKGAEDGKNLRNLFFIALAPDELPSFHFWTKPNDKDPVTAGAPIDWGRVFDKNPPSPATTARITTLENERKEQAQRAAEQNMEGSQPLAFLDTYAVANNRSSGTERTQGQPADDGGSMPQTDSARILANSPKEAEVLLQFNRGGMYLREFTHRALYNMAGWLVKNEEDEEDNDSKDAPLEADEMFLDIMEPRKDVREEKIASVSRVSTRTFQEKIKPSFGGPENKFRVRSAKFQSWWNYQAGFDSGGVGDLKHDLKLVRPNVGYCYCSASWHDAARLLTNSDHFEKAIQFLFDWEQSTYPKSNNLSLDIPGHGSFDLDRNSDLLLKANVQKIFAELSTTPAAFDSRPVEIFIRDIPEDITDISDMLGPHSPMTPKSNRETGIRGSPEELHSKKVGGGPGVSSMQSRLLTNTEIKKLQERLRLAEASVVETDDLQEQLRVAEEKIGEMSSLRERLKASEDRARVKSSCPFCPQDWTGATKQQQQDHLKLHQKDIVHQPAAQECPHPNCKCWLGENQDDSTHEAIAQHLRFHIEEEHAEDGICEHPNCHANMYALTAEQQEAHESSHLNTVETEKKCDQLQEKIKSLQKALKKLDREQGQARDLEDIVKERDQLQERVKDLEELATERERSQQQTLQEATDEQNQRQEDFMQVQLERDMFKDRVVELEVQLQSTSSRDEGLQSNSRGPETQVEVEEDPESVNHPKGPRKLRYCNICLKSVDKLSDTAKIKHADKCETNVSDFPLLTTAEAKTEREKKDARDVVRPKDRQAEEEPSGPPTTRKKGKEKISAKAASSENLRHETEAASTTQQPEASKMTGHKSVKRKADTFKPSNEDESDDEEPEAPRKRPKRKADTFKPSKEDESDDEEPEAPMKKPKFKAKAVKAQSQESAPTRRSARHKESAEPPGTEGDEGGDGEGADKERSSSARRGREKKRARSKN